MSMKSMTAAGSLAAALIAFVLSCVGAAGAQERMINPRTHLAADALQVLKQAGFINKMNSQSWTASNPTLCRFYAHKVVEIEDLIKSLQSGRAVSLDAVDRALDNHDARRLGGDSSPVRFKQSL